MTDAECVALLQWALPHLELRWAGFRKFRGQVCKRIQRRMAQLGILDVATYRARLDVVPAEWKVLAGLCVVTLSRFFRDRAVWDTLRDEVLPAAAEAAAAAKDEALRCWSIGCASGEEPYTLSVLWVLGLAHRYPGLRLRILATDIDEDVLRRAHLARYAAGTLRDLPTGWLDHAFERHDGSFRLRERFRAAVELRREDVRFLLPDEVFRVILCRNLVCTYFDETLQRATLGRLLTRLSEGGAFVAGRKERLPPGMTLEPWHPRHGIYRHAPTRLPALPMSLPGT
jgi:chemotaxis protein methyltransferase CheR